VSRPIPEPKVWPDAIEESMSRRLWAGFMVARDVQTCESICYGRPGRAGNLDRFVLRRALRGGRLPDHEAYLLVSGEMPDAIDEAGIIVERKQANL
jgi:hypothetical protein